MQWPERDVVRLTTDNFGRRLPAMSLAHLPLPIFMKYCQSITLQAGDVDFRQNGDEAASLIAIAI